MTIASEILKAQNNLKDCYDVCKSVDGVVLPEDKNFDNLPALIEQALNPFNKPSDWSDIRKDCPANSIALYAGHTPLQQWTLGDRLDNKATFVGYFDSVNPDTNTAQRYAYFLLDAAYRSTSALKDNTSGVLSANSPIPVNATYTDALAAKESATYNCAKLEAAGTFPPIDFAKAVSVNYNGNTYYGVIPNATELLEIYNNRETLDTYDPTITDYATLSLTEWASGQKSRVWTSNGGDASTGNGLTFWEKKKTGTGNNAWYIPTQINNSNFAGAAFPIIEIPVDNSNIQYDNLGFTATCTGGYKVYIDGTQYGSTYASGAQCNITWSSLALDTGDDITTPTALKAHKIWVEPATAGNNITAFRMNDRTGLLWLHSNISTEFNSIANFVGATAGSSLIKAVTAKNNVLKSKNMVQAFGKCPYLEYLPVLDFDNSDRSIAYICYNPTSEALKKITIRNLKQVGNVSNSDAFNNNQGLKKIILKNSSLCWYQNTFRQNLYSLEELPKGLYNAPGSIEFRNAKTLKPTDLDFRDRTQATYIKVYGDATNPMYGVKSVRVSNQAPFNDTTAPQINISYTGMNRQALVTIFNDLPTVANGQIINITNAVGAADLTAEDKAIATDKGWTIAL